MRPQAAKPQKAKSRAGTSRWSEARLDRLAEEATIDCYGESECATGFLTMIEENVAFPFSAEVLGIPITVERVDLSEPDEIVAICRKEGHRQRILLRDLPLPSPPPAGAEWIAAYRRWAKAWNGATEES